MRYLGFILAFAAAAASADPEVKHELSFESGVRGGGTFDVNRAGYQLSVKQTGEKVPVEFQSEVRAFANASHSNFGLTETSVAFRTLRASYWGNRWGVSAGLQQITWSETFGYQPVDVANARDFRDFGPLDHGRNRIPAWNVNGFFSLGPIKVSGYASPQGQVPLLPSTFQGMAVQNDFASGDWFTYPEAGVRLSTTLNDSNASIFAYHHLSRVPAFLMGTPGTLTARYRPVESFGATFSRGFSEVVVRADGILTLNHPESGPGLASVVKENTYNAAAGVDWSPTRIEDFTVGAQVTLDRFAVAGSEARVGAALMARKGFFSGKWEIEGRAFSRFRSADYWLQASSRLRLGDSWEWKLGGEALGDHPSSPSSLLGYTSRAYTQLSLFF